MHKSVPAFWPRFGVQFSDAVRQPDVHQIYLGFNLSQFTENMDENRFRGLVALNTTTILFPKRMLIDFCAKRCAECLVI